MRRLCKILQERSICTQPITKRAFAKSTMESFLKLFILLNYLFLMYYIFSIIYNWLRRMLCKGFILFSFRQPCESPCRRVTHCEPPPCAPTPHCDPKPYCVPQGCLPTHGHTKPHCVPQGCLPRNKCVSKKPKKRGSTCSIASILCVPAKRSSQVCCDIQPSPSVCGKCSNTSLCSQRSSSHLCDTGLPPPTCRSSTTCADRCRSPPPPCCEENAPLPSAAKLLDMIKRKIALCLSPRYDCYDLQPRSKTICKKSPRCESPCKKSPRCESPCKKSPRCEPPCKKSPRCEPPCKKSSRCESPCKKSPRCESPCKKSPPCDRSPRKKSPRKCKKQRGIFCPSDHCVNDNVACVNFSPQEHCFTPARKIRRNSSPRGDCLPEREVLVCRKSSPKHCLPEREKKNRRGIFSSPEHCLPEREKKIRRSSSHCLPDREMKIAKKSSSCLKSEREKKIRRGDSSSRTHCPPREVDITCVKCPSREDIHPGRKNSRCNSSCGNSSSSFENIRVEFNLKAKRDGNCSPGKRGGMEKNRSCTKCGKCCRGKK